MNNPYRVLRVHQGDSLSDIKAMYRRLCHIYHPDVPGTGNAEKFEEITKAWHEIEKSGTRKKAIVIYGHKTLFSIKRRML